MYLWYVYECRGVPDFGAPAITVARSNIPENAQADADSGPSPTGRESQRHTFCQSAKKILQMGRPIVSFVQAQGRSLWESFADVLYLMIRQACPDATEEGSSILQLQRIKQHFQKLSAGQRKEPWMTDEVTRVNQDLAGFFTSISSDRREVDVL